MATTIVVILGSAFSDGRIGGVSLIPVPVETPHGNVVLYRNSENESAYVLFRHGVPGDLLSHHIPYVANAAALSAIGCDSLLVTSSVAIVDTAVPLDTAHFVSDLYMPDNRLPDGKVCSMDHKPSRLKEDLLISPSLTESIEEVANGYGQRLVAGYAVGPRFGTRAEREAFRRAGAEVLSLTIGPEIVLASELGIQVAALVFTGDSGRDTLTPIVAAYLAGAGT